MTVNHWSFIKYVITGVLSITFQHVSQRINYLHVSGTYININGILTVTFKISSKYFSLDIGDLADASIEQETKT